MKKRICLFFVLGFFILGMFLFFWPKDFFKRKEVIFRVERGESMKQISDQLYSEGLIRWDSVFRAYVTFTMNSKRLQAGSYKLSSAMGIFQIVNKFVFGDTIKEILTVPEGQNIRDIAQEINSKGIINSKDFFELVGSPAVDYRDFKKLVKPKDFSVLFSFLKDKPNYVSLEGYLFPDTYYISQETTANELLAMILSNFDKKLTQDLRTEIKKQNKTIFEIITMASVIEKEVRAKEDMELVSGILWKRLRVGMPLQSCATISYITAKRSTDISIDETQIDSLYNTYKYRGLPLGPISNPGVEAIKAAIFPKENLYWYFLNTSDGKTIFSKTLEEHNIAKAKYLN